TEPPPTRSRARPRILRPAAYRLRTPIRTGLSVPRITVRLDHQDSHERRINLTTDGRLHQGKDRTRHVGATDGRERAVDNNAVQQSQFVYLSGCETPVLSRLTYVPGAPFTVTMAFKVAPGEWVEWEVARDLLITGLHAPAGI